MQVKRLRDEEDEASNPLRLARFPSSSGGNQATQKAFSNIQVRDGSRAHIGDVVNTINLNFLDEDETKARRIIDSLYFVDIDRRRDAVAYASPSTFKWLLDADMAPIAEPVAEARSMASAGRDLSEFQKQLHDERKKREQERHQYRIDTCHRITSWMRSKSGVFWISGAAASGKSTLMKFLRNSERSCELLLQWAGGSQLVVADHYFWHTGSSLQKSHEGLYRTILYKIFKTDAKITKVACNNWWDSMNTFSSCSESEFFEAIASLDRCGMKLCLFIDGLDEYHPQVDHYQLVDTILKLSKLSNVKICVSSRPWQIFKEAFPHLDRQLALHELNRVDLENFAIEKLRQHTARTSLSLEFEQPMSEQAADFVDDFVSRSQGVFLWAFLVIQRLTARVKFVEQLSELKKYMLQFPTELEQYFRDLIFERINPAWKSSAETAAVLVLVLNEFHSLPYFWSLVTSRAVEDADFGISQPVQFFPDSWFDAQIRRTLSFLKDCCPDLLLLRDNHLESEEYEPPYYKEWVAWRIDFAHRTIEDFLETEEMQRHLKQHCPRHLQLRSLCELQLALYKHKVMSTGYKWISETPLETYETLDEIFYFARLAAISGRVDILQEYERVLLRVSQQFPKLFQCLPDDMFEEATLYDLACYLFAYRLHSFCYLLARNELHRTFCADAMLEGALGLVLTSDVTGKDEEYPLASISLSNVEAALEYEPNLINPSVSPYNHPDGYGISSDTAFGRSTWHEFLFKWWRCTPDTIWGRHNDSANEEREQLPELGSPDPNIKKVVFYDYSKRKCKYLVPNQPFAGLSYGHAPGDDIRPWQVAKALIQKGACVNGTLCLTDNRCPVSKDGTAYRKGTLDDVEEAFLNFHPSGACWQASVIDVLRALVPLACREELETIWEAQKSRDMGSAEKKNGSDHEDNLFSSSAS